MKTKSLMLFPLWHGFPKEGAVQLSDSIVLDECPPKLLDTDIATLLPESYTFIYWSPFGHRGTLLPPKDGREAYGRLIAVELQALQPATRFTRRDQANWALIRSIPSDLLIVLRWIF